ncbi:MAG: L,D-transpeptidase family protein [Hyphomicrobiaceae bacterium]
MPDCDLLGHCCRFQTPDPSRIQGKWSRFERYENRIRWQFGLPLHGTPNYAKLDARLAFKGLAAGAPIFLRIFKEESDLELWMQKGDRFVLAVTYPICKWSGTLGPKLKEGDRQTPEGFYSVARHQLNPNSRWHRSFNVGFPNAFDRALKRTGSFIMVHGGCSSIGCYAITDDGIDEVWRLVNAAFANGQKRFQVQSFPFRMTRANLARQPDHPWAAFWEDLKHGYDLFESTRIPPRVSVCNKRYAFETGNPGGKGDHSINQRCSQQARPDPGVKHGRRG